MSNVQTVRIDANIEWRVKRSSASNRWIGVCDSLNLALEADTFDELQSVIGEAMHVLMTDLLEDDEFEQYLQERGWTASAVPVARGGHVEFDVPFHIVAEGTVGSERRAQ